MLSDLLVSGCKLLAMAAPWGEKLYHDMLVRVSDNLYPFGHRRAGIETVRVLQRVADRLRAEASARQETAKEEKAALQGQLARVQAEASAQQVSQKKKKEVTSTKLSIVRSTTDDCAASSAALPGTVLKTVTGWVSLHVDYCFC